MRAQTSQRFLRSAPLLHHHQKWQTSSLATEWSIITIRSRTFSADSSDLTKRVNILHTGSQAISLNAVSRLLHPRRNRLQLGLAPPTDHLPYRYQNPVSLAHSSRLLRYLTPLNCLLQCPWSAMVITSTSLSTLIMVFDVNVQEGSWAEFQCRYKKQVQQAGIYKKRTPSYFRGDGASSASVTKSKD